MIALDAMPEAPEALLAHARDVTREARRLPLGETRNRMRQVARVYHLLARQSGWISPAELRDNLRVARRAEAMLQASRAAWSR
jgi:hypothetical protein